MEFGKNCLCAAAYLFLLLSGLAGHGFALPSTTSSSERTTVKSFSSTQPWSPSSSSEIITTTTMSSTTTTATTTLAATTTTEEQEEELQQTTTTLPPPSTKKVVAAVEEHGNDNKSKDDSSDNTTTIIIVCCCVGGLILLVIVGAYFIYRCLKKRAAKQTQSEPNAKHPDGTSKADIKPKNPHTPQPPVVASNPWAPEHVPASTFACKGPLVLQTRPPAEIPMVHELDNEQPPSFHESHHVEFDDTQNVVVEIGSDVEVFMDGDKKLPKKARSSLPSPYAESGGKAGGASGGGKAKKKLSEKQKDKAIRE